MQIWLPSFGHPELSRVATGLLDLYETGELSEYEADRAVAAAARLETLASHFWTDLNHLADQPLPDPGVRPLARHIWPGAYRKKPDFVGFLGYFHRCREFHDRLAVAVAARVAA